VSRFARQELVAGFGPDATRRLRGSCVAVVGAGGLGSPALLYLAGGGVGRITIIDADSVSETDLHRQILYTEDDLGRPKAPAAAARLQALDKSLQILPLAERFTEADAKRLLEGCDLVVGAVDSHESRYEINRAALGCGIPNVFAAVAGIEAQVCAFSPRGAPCYRCLFPCAPGEAVPSPSVSGVLGPVAGIAGTLQALLAMRILAGLPVSWGSLFLFDGATLQSRRVTVPADRACPDCGRV